MSRFFSKIINWYFAKDALPYWCILFLDCSIVLCVYFISYYSIYKGEGIFELFWQKFWVVSALMIIYALSFKIFHTYANIIRYSSFVDLFNVIKANALSSVVVLALRIIVFNEVTIFPGVRVVALTFAFATLALWGWRVIVKFLFDTCNLDESAINVFIYGVKDGGIGLAKSISNQKQNGFVLKGFIKPGNEPASGYLLGKPVFSEQDDLIKIMDLEKIRGIIISPIQAALFRNNDKLINELTENKIKIFMMPPAVEWDGKQELDHQNLKTVDIEDLLPRDEIQVDMEAIGKLLHGKKILITGAAGSIGSEIVKQVAAFSPADMVLIDQAETPMHDIRLFMSRDYSYLRCKTIVTSITKKERMEQIFADVRPDYVFHAAAYKHVPMMEDNPAEAVQNNIYGTRVIADLAVKYRTKKFVMISTDKAVNPTNVMGCSKRICEIYVQSLNQAIKDGEIEGVTQFVTTRFGNVLGSNGSVIPIFREQIMNGGPVTVTHPDIIRFFMLIPEACKLVLQAGTFGQGGEIFVFDMGKPVKIATLAKRMIALSNAKNVEIKYTGLRDGEKLYEEVLNDAELTKETSHPKIKIAQVREYPYDEASKNEERLLAASFNSDDMGIVKIMKEIVPEFKSQHSKYQVLD